MKLSLGVQVSMKDVGWTSVDLQGNPDIRCGAWDLEAVPDGSCEIIVASHILEHGPYQGRGEHRVAQTVKRLKHWRDKIIPGGIILIAVPDLDKLCDAIRHYRTRYWDMDDSPLMDLIGPTLGGGETEYNRHRMLYNEPCLTHCLCEAGFKKPTRVMRADPLFMPQYNASAKHWSSLNMRAANPC